MDQLCTPLVTGHEKGSRGLAGAVPGEGLAAINIAEYRVVSARWLYPLREMGSYSSTGKKATAVRPACGSSRSGPNEKFGTAVRVVAKD